jgi:hypothetical protein
LRPRPCGSGRSGRVDVDHDDRHADLDRGAGLDEQLGHDPRERAGQLDERLGRLDLDDRLVHGHRVADRDVPGDDLGLGQALAGVGEAELLEGRHAGLLSDGGSGGGVAGIARDGQKAMARSTASSTRSTPGR